jgi:sarcosine oxidase subunit beta
MMHTADIVIIGAGITGCALFHELTRCKAGKILLIEKNHIASGTTGQSGGLIRKLFQHPATENYAIDSFDYYQNFIEETGYSCGFVETGCQYWINEQDEPINESEAGCIDTVLTCENWVKSAQNQKSSLMLSTSVNEIVTKNQQIIGVLTSQGIIHCANIIVAAGAWSTELLQPFYGQLPIVKKAFKFHYFHQQQHALRSAVIDFRQQCYLIPTRSNTIIAGSLTDDDCSEISYINKASYISSNTAVDAFSEQAPGIISKSPHLKGLYVASGWSGGGIKIAPTVAKALVRLLMDS